MAKRREQFIYIGSDERFEQILVSGDSFSLPDDGRTYYIFHQREYQRARKPKVLYALFQFFGSRSIKVDPIQELRKYDGVFAIDTNSDRVAITTAAKASWIPRKGVFAVQKIFTRKSAPKMPKPERAAWMDFIVEAGSPKESHNCLVVDSDLGSLMKINRREEPVMPDFFLPGEWQLNYATSDASDEFVLVKMMRLCEAANKRGKPIEYAEIW